VTRCDEDSVVPSDARDRRTLFLAGGPYHWHQAGDRLRLRKGYAHDDPARPQAEATAAYRAWMSR